MTIETIKSVKGLTPFRLVGTALLAAALAAAWAAPRRAGDRVVLAAVDAETFAGLAGQRPEAASDLWERLAAMGVRAAMLREQTLADLAARGEVLDFSRAEVEKWRAAGLVSASAGLRGGTLWAKDPQALSRAAAALAARGLDVSSGSLAGARALELPLGVDLASVPAGFNPKEVAALSTAGLIPVAISTGPVAAVAGRSLWTRTLPVDARPGEILRAALSRPLRLIVFRPRADWGVENNLERLRAALHVLRDAGQPAVLPASRGASPADAAERRARLILIWFLGAAGALLAARAALQTAHRTRARVCAAAPIASPAPQVLAGLAAAWLTAAFTGLVVAGLAPEGWRDGGARAWVLWTWCAPLAVGACALSAASGSARRRGWSAPVRRRDFAALAAFALAAAVLLAPRASLRAESFWESFDRLSAAGILWWWPWHWRAVVIGVPCLMRALALIEMRDSSETPQHAPPGPLSDPRGWLLLGLLGPAELIASIGGGGAPLTEALTHGLWTWILALAVGAALAGAFSLLWRIPRATMGG